MQGKVDAANQAQKDNPVLFLNQFKALSGEVSDLKTQVRTEALQKKLDTVQTELVNTQKAMAPGPKAKLAFIFWPFLNPPLSSGLPVPVTDTNLPVSSDGSVHVEFSILNLTSVDAVNVTLNLVVCNECKFAREVEGFTKLAGQLDTQRFINLPQIHALECLRTIEVDIIVPVTLSTFQIGLMYRCHSCVLPTEVTKGTVHVTRDFVRTPK